MKRKGREGRKGKGREKKRIGGMRGSKAVHRRIEALRRFGGQDFKGR